MTGEWAEFDAIVATSHRVEKYGGIRLGEDALQQIAAALNRGGVPMLSHHDPTRPVRTRDLLAGVVSLPDGERAVRIAGLINAEDWAAAGEIRGMSFAYPQPIGRADGPYPQAEPLRLSADAAWFDDATIAHACSLMSALAPVEGNRLYQFSAVEDLRVIVEIGTSLVAALGPNLAASAVWDGLKYMLIAVTPRRKRIDPAATSRVELVTPLPTGNVTAVIDTVDVETARQALAAYSAAVETAARAAAGSTVVQWSPSPDGGKWISKKK